MTSLRIGVLTTDTPHHRYFLREVHRRMSGAALAFALFETAPYPWRRRARRHLVRKLPNLWQGLALNPYIQSSHASNRQLAWEKAAFFPEGDDRLPRDLPVSAVGSVNDPNAERIIADMRPDCLFVYGTGLIKPPIYMRPPLGALNAHGGLLPGYRGLDTNLWAALEGRPEDMAITLNVVDADFDTGPVALQRRLTPVRGLSALTLRYQTTLLCIELFLEAAAHLIAGTLQPRRQSGPSRYFGPMPMLLKRRADRIIRDYGEGAANPRGAIAV